MSRADIAKQNFLKGYTCAQAVLLAFSDITGADEETAMKISLPFGGGMGRMRLTCGAVSGMVMAPVRRSIRQIRGTSMRRYRNLQANSKRKTAASFAANFSRERI